MEIIQVCIVCRENVSKNEIYRHLCMAMMVCEPRRKPCEHCGKQFSSTLNLLRHLDMAHMDKKIHKCDRCQQVFGMKLLMDYHMQSHDKIDQELANNLTCKICSIIFKSSLHFENHKVFHSEISKKG